MLEVGIQKRVEKETLPPSEAEIADYYETEERSLFRFPESRDACLAAGMDGFVTKPLDRERLMAALARFAAARAA